MRTLAGRERPDDPFAPEHLARLPYRADGLDWDDVLDRLEAAGWEGAVSGPPGSGRSAFLAALGRVLEDVGFGVVRVRLDRDRPDPVGRGLAGLARAVGPDDVVVVDDADGLGVVGWWRLRRVARRAAGLVAATRGTSPLPALHACRASAGLLEEILLDLLPWGPRPTPTELRRVWLRSGGDLGAALAALRARHARERATGDRAAGAGG